MIVACGVICVSRFQGARNLALRRILATLFAIRDAVAIIFLSKISALAYLLQVGRRTDLLVYAIVVASQHRVANPAHEAQALPGSRYGTKANSPEES